MRRAILAYRLVVLGMLVAMAVSIALLARQSTALDARIASGEAHLSLVSKRLTDRERNALTRRDLGSLRNRLETRVAAAVERVTALEERASAVTRVIAAASESIVFLQGAYRFIDKETGRTLRYTVGPDGRPLATPRGPAVTLEGTGPPVESQFTGTAFLATPARVLITNRHVALPWESNAIAGDFAARGLEPIMQRFVGYLPSRSEPFDIELLAASKSADVAILEGAGIPADAPYLALNAVPPRPGDEVIVLGYPTGIRALLARADASVVETLQMDALADFWRVGEFLSERNHISPLASRGIVGQVTAATIAYDAETAQGGSGSPVLELDGKVMAINTAVIPDFNGSNLGVLATSIARMLRAFTPSVADRNDDEVS